MIEMMYMVLIEKPEAMISLLKDIKIEKALTIFGNIEDATIDVDGKLWIQISKDNKDMTEAIAKVLKRLKSERVFIIVKCKELEEIKEVKI